MAENEDPFESAMSSLDSDDTDNPFDTDIEAMASDSDGASSETKKSAPVDPFEVAMQAMETGANVNTASVDPDAGDDPFAAALEVAKAEHKVAEAQKTDEAETQELDIDFLMEIKLNLTFEVGRTKMYISDLLSLGQGSVIELHRLVGEELELCVNGQLLATGEVVVVNEKFGARISKILSPEERINHLGTQITF
ncbi:flagellar motor switch protein FliN [bacterium]|nr:flagellar motor switch protein FliN [bacterium]